MGTIKMGDELLNSVSLDYSEWLRYKELVNGIIRFYGEIDSASVFDFLVEVGEVSRLKLSKVIIYMSSPGGGVYDAFAMYDAIKRLSSAGTKVEIVVEGLAASAAAMIVLQAANERISRPSARFLFHEIRKWVVFREEKSSDLNDEVKEINVLTEKIVEIMASRSNCSVDDIRKLVERKEVYMSAVEAKDWGLIDRIM